VEAKVMADPATMGFGLSVKPLTTGRHRGRP